MSLKKLTGLVTDLNFGKVTSAITTSTKNLDVSDITSALKKTTTNLVDSTASATKKTASDVASSLKKFEGFPGAQARLSQVTTAMAKHPKISAVGITGLAAAGYVAYLMGEGATFEEAIGELADLVEDVAEDIVETAVDKATSAITGTTGILLEGIFGENYMYYVYGGGSIFLLIVIMRIVAMVKMVFR